MSSNPIPQGKYKPAVRHGAFIFTAGMTPRKDGKLIKSGKIMKDASPEEYREAVYQAAANALTAARNCLKEGEKIVQVMNLNVFIYSEDGYTTQAKIGDLASDYLLSELGDAGIGARAAISVACLPGEAPVEIQLVVAVE